MKFNQANALVTSTAASGVMNASILGSHQDAHAQNQACIPMKTPLVRLATY
jgi:hypothetical protein